MKIKIDKIVYPSRIGFPGKGCVLFVSWQGAMTRELFYSKESQYRHGTNRACNHRGNLFAMGLLLFLLAQLTGCTIEPWVKPYEREYLADPIMSFSRNPLWSQYRQHVYETREGSRGAKAASGGGCGCN